jgi:hypothetical protein
MVSLAYEVGLALVMGIIIHLLPGAVRDITHPVRLNRYGVQEAWPELERGRIPCLQGVIARIQAHLNIPGILGLVLA